MSLEVPLQTLLIYVTSISFESLKNYKGATTIVVALYLRFFYPPSLNVDSITPEDTSLYASLSLCLAHCWKPIAFSDSRLHLPSSVLAPADQDAESRFPSIAQSDWICFRFIACSNNCIIFASLLRFIPPTTPPSCSLSLLETPPYQYPFHPSKSKQNGAPLTNGVSSSIR